jgi:hypothetical protein
MELEATCADYKRRETSHAKEIIDHHKTIDTLQNEKEQLEELVVTLKEANKKQESELDKTRAQMYKLTGESESLLRKMTDSKEELATYKESMQKLDSII